MLNEDKVRLMTRLSIYEKRKGKKLIPIGKYHKKDYVALKLFQTLIAVAVAYIGMIGIWVLTQFETILKGLNEINFVSLGVKLFIGFAVLETVFAFAALMIYSRRHEKAVKSLKGYYNNLKRLGNYYQE